MEMQDHPFGMVMPNRSYSAGTYRFGFNNQEKDDEICGAGNTNTAMFWEYSTRLGRRWNLDPITKPWRSPYDVLDNNPLWYIDPNGDDDFFNRKGQFLGSTATGHVIRIVNDKVTFNAASKDIHNTTKRLSSFNYLYKNTGNASMLSTVALFYAKQIGINQTINITASNEEVESGAAASYRPSDDSYHILVNDKTGNINKSIDNYANLTTLLTHEKDHKDDPSTRTEIYHIRAVVKETESKYFNETDLNYKYSRGGYAAQLLNRALSKGSSVADVENEIDNFNNSKLGDYVYLDYDSSSKSVVSKNLISTINVKPK